ncbi:glycosyltransferase family 31 protein [Cadophora sp. DSE1049]|nr:glycosyltransferase family 31 protein [Cadophora sp. DSE1049]
MPTKVAFSFLSQFSWSVGLRRMAQCPETGLADNIVVAVKTGASEASEKIPTLMQTSLRCAKNVFFFSDLEQDIGPYHLNDALANISSDVKKLDGAFEFYRLQQEAWRRDGSVESTKGMKDPSSPSNLAAWTLDKYKNTHILEKVWEFAPEKEWYIVIDADTYVIWSNLLRWLPSLDSAKKMFLGSVAFLESTGFAHGGSGTIFSRSLMRDYAVTRNGTATRLDSKIHTSCCGDVMVSEVLREYGNDLINIQPSISGQKPGTIPYHTDYWCQPSLTMHHFDAEDMKAFHQFESGRENTSTPLTWAEMFEGLVKHQLQSMPDMQEDWDNYSSVVDVGSGILYEGVKKTTTQSFEECATTCEANTECVQYTFDGEACYWGKAIRLGERRMPEDGKHWRSGWNQTRMADWISKQPKCNDVVEFPDWRKGVHY